MRRDRYRVLVFIGRAAGRAAESFRKPVAWADERRFGVDVVRTLLVSGADLAFVEGSRADQAVGSKIRCDRIGCIASRVIEQDLGDLFRSEEGEGQVEPVEEGVNGVNGLRDE